MEGANRGPYAKVIKLKNGHYRRIVEPVVPEIIIKLWACCNTDISQENFDLVTNQSEQNYNIKADKIDKEYDDEELSTRQNNEFSDGYYNDKVNQRSKSMESFVDYGNLADEDQFSEQMDVKKRENQSELMVFRGGSKEERNVTQTTNEGMDVGENGIHFDEGVPVLFYTKMRDKPTLLSLTVDRNTQVIYMKKNKISRFFPIKLIRNFVTYPEIIKEEFSKQIKSDPRTKISNMVMFRASNFTDSVAIQFADESAKADFMKEVEEIKDLMRNDV